MNAIRKFDWFLLLIWTIYLKIPKYIASLLFHVPDVTKKTFLGPCCLWQLPPNTCHPLPPYHQILFSN